MTDHEAAWRAHQRARWMRPDADRWMRPDAERWIGPEAARFLKPGTKLADLYPALTKKYRPDQPRIPAGQFGGGRWTDDLGNAPGTVRELMPPKTVAAPAELPKKPTRIGGGSNAATASQSLADLIKPIPAATSDDLTRNLRQIGGGNTGRRIGISAGDAFPGTTARQLLLLDRAMERSSDTLAQVRQYDPEWKPREFSYRRPGSVEGAIAEAEARAKESEAHLDQLRSGIGGNLGPPLDPPRQSLPSMRPFDGQGWINVYRTIYNAPNLFGEPVWRPETGTVAAAEIDGKLYFGVNSGSPGYTSTDRTDANSQRSNLIDKYPQVMTTDNIGEWPNDSLYHAESTILLRAARQNGGSLADRTIEIVVDRRICESCNDALPILGLQLGNPTVRFSETKTGRVSVMSNGTWLIWRRH